MITLPGDDRQWNISQESDIYGNIVAAKNIDLEKKGYLRLARKAMALYSEAQDADFSTVIAIGADQNKVYVVTVDGFFSIDITNNTLPVTKHVGSDTPLVDFNSDIESFNNQPHVTGTTDMRSYNAGSDVFTTRVNDLSASYPHPMCKHSGRQTLLLADGNVCRQYSTGYSRDTTNELTLPAEYIITRILYRNGNAYLLTRNIAGGEAKVFKWLGVGVGNNGEYGGTGADWIYSGCLYGNLIAVITSRGELLQFNGDGFTQLAALPVFYSDLPWTSLNSTANILGNVASRGMDSDGASIYININGALNNLATAPGGQYLPDMPSGLWHFSPKTGLAPRAGANYQVKLSLQPTSADSGFLTFGTPHQLITADPILCANASGISGVNAGQTYYAIISTTTSIKLGLSPAEAKAGYAIAISGTPNVQDVWEMDSYDSMGQGQIVNTGPIFLFKKLVPNAFYGVKLFFAARLFTNTLANRGVLMSLGMGRNIGYFVTPKIGSSSVTESFQKLLAKYPMLNLTSDEIIIKYRVTERYGVPSHLKFSGNLTFTSPTTFIVDPSGKDIRTLIVGDEVEFVTGAASGYVAHITNINTDVPSSYVFTIDVTLPVSNDDKTDFVCQNWTKYIPKTSTDDDNSQNFTEQSIENTTTWVQFKVLLKGRSLSMEQIMIISKPGKTTN